MKRLAPVTVALGCLSLSLGVFSVPVHAQTSSSLTNDPYFVRHRALESVTYKLGIALQKGDVKGVIALLAPDFELGHFQYQWRGPEWMRQFLTQELKRTKFKKFNIGMWGNRDDANLSFTIGSFDVETTPHVPFASDFSGTKGDYSATWKETKAGWRLQRIDGLFDSLLHSEWIPPSTPTPPPSAATMRAKAISSLPLQEPLFVLKLPYFEDRVNSFNFSPDGQVVATVYGGNELHFSLAKNGVLLKAVFPGFMDGVAYSPDGTFLTQNLHAIFLRDGKSGAVKFTLLETDVIGYLCASPDGRTLAVKAGEKVQLWDIPTRRRTKAFGQFGNGMGPMQFTPDNRILSVLGPTGIQLWDVREGTKMQSLDGANGWILEDGKTVVTVSGLKLSFRTIGSDTIIRESKLPDELRAHNPDWGTLRFFFPSEEVAVAPNGKIAARIYADGSIIIWDTESGALLRLLRGFQGKSPIGLADISGNAPPGHNVSALAFSLDSQTLAAGSYTGEAAIWDVSSP